jgi:hypothetical protein
MSPSSTHRTTRGIRATACRGASSCRSTLASRRRTPSRQSPTDSKLRRFCLYFFFQQPVLENDTFFRRIVACDIRRTTTQSYDVVDHSQVNHRKKNALSKCLTVGDQAFAWFRRRAAVLIDANIARLTTLGAVRVEPLAHRSARLSRDQHKL